MNSLRRSALGLAWAVTLGSAFVGCGSGPVGSSSGGAAGLANTAAGHIGQGGAGGVAGAAGSAGTGGSEGGSPGSAGGGRGDGAAPGDDAPTHSVLFTPGTDTILNPERGFYATTNLVDVPDLLELRSSGATLVHSYVRLDDYRTSDLPSSLLSGVSAGFARARAAGVKVILRFAYNFGPYPDSAPDAPKSWVVKHIGQLKPLLEANADVIAIVQAGFIGAWGEWHTSSNGLTEPTARKEILEALLGAVPTERSVQLRYPAYKQLLYGPALTPEQAFDGTPVARVGHHNDCFVSSATDVGTYPDAEVDRYRDYVAADTAFVPMGGETCAVSAPRSECSSALAEMAKLHMSYINREFHAEVLASWQPCRDEMERRLGYRLLLKSAALPVVVKPGGSFTLSALLENEGFAAPFNARPVYVVLRGDGKILRALLTKVEPRRWLTGASLTARLRLPAELAAGSYTLSLWLPDAAATLRDRTEYALRLANDAVWDEASGENRLGSFEVAADAPGGAVSDADAFSVLAEE